MTATKRKPCDRWNEKRCTEPYTWDDGVPYCDSCGLYRWSVHMQEQVKTASKPKRKR